MRAEDFIELFPASLSRSETRVGSGELVFRQGDPSRGVFAVISGRVKLERSTVDGREAILHVAMPGECFAESSLFADQYHCDAVATTESTIVLFSKEDLLHHLRTDTKISLRYISLLCSEVRTLRSRLELSSILSARDRIHQYLVRMVDPETRELVLTGTLKELAAELGLAHETLYRELRKMEDAGWLERRGGRLLLSER